MAIVNSPKQIGNGIQSGVFRLENGNTLVSAFNRFTVPNDTDFFNIKEYNSNCKLIEPLNGETNVLRSDMYGKKYLCRYIHPEDYNFDRKFDLLDILTLIDYIFYPNSYTKFKEARGERPCNLDKNSNVDLNDLYELIKFIQLQSN